ncbi:MAG: cation:proton antiporter, partial [Candidatus Tectomicrobia bacterium]|nr:cation:proton antiporter [Candidatus Tectomicrobia bacterium]
FGWPRVAAYVVAGMAFSPALLGGWLDLTVEDWAEPLTTMALGIIAYVIGGSLTLTQVRRTGKLIVSATIGAMVGSMLLVLIALLFWLPGSVNGIATLHLALAFSVIASTTAPAGTLAIIHQYRARGPMVSTLLGVVALDDALGIILFALVLIATSGVSLTVGLGLAVLEVGGSVAVGAAAGYMLSRLARWVHQGGLRLPLILATVLLVLGVAQAWGLSSLLSTMTLGFCTRHFLGAGGDRLFAPVEYFEELVFLIFFSLAGAHFQPHVFLAHLDLMIVYLLGRTLGKLLGASIGARIGEAPQPVVRWLGCGLVPQAGVAVGLALTLSHQPVFREISSVIVNVILGATIIYEVLGPFMVRFALERAGEIGVKRRRVQA